MNNTVIIHFDYKFRIDWVSIDAFKNKVNVCNWKLHLNELYTKCIHQILSIVIHNILVMNAKLFVNVHIRWLFKYCTLLKLWKITLKSYLNMWRHTILGGIWCLASRNILMDRLSMNECNVEISTRWFGCYICNYTHKYLRCHLKKAPSDPIFVLSEFSCMSKRIAISP